ncbi:hypothetical protein N7474_001937 [Penicillium riverlandense]|uniref:uncharacterized protein n=1 Tax=Penicillium riverlandense TaxID=1903569 RepID=UPI002546C331|nr:uncharacterized protein N7474_001937 [Penicillium riverlandense]KAJ5833626.1 hypothetical protein N7474_001937 [Penicillium riverlandense]
MEKELEKQLTEQQIKSLLVRERYYRDTAQWENLRDSYHPDVSKTAIKITWFEGDADGFVAGSQKMAGGGTNATHTICPVVVHVNGDKAVTESTGSINARFNLEGHDYDCASYARFISRLQKVNGEWKLLTLHAIYDRDTITPAVPMSSPPANFDLTGYRPSYNCIGWLLARKGFQINQDLPGSDRPELIAQLMDEAWNWLK